MRISVIYLFFPQELASFSWPLWGSLLLVLAILLSRFGNLNNLNLLSTRTKLLYWTLWVFLVTIFWITYSIFIENLSNLLIFSTRNSLIFLAIVRFSAPSFCNLISRFGNLNNLNLLSTITNHFLGHFEVHSVLVFG